MRLKYLCLVFALALNLVFSFQGKLQAETDKNKDFHTIHMLMNHGLTMILDGSTLIMMAELDIDTTIEKDQQTHGKRMIAEGKTLVERAFRGPVMVEKHVQEKGATPMMELTHELGELMLRTAYGLDIMQPRQGSDIAQKLHLLHIEANHALIMAAQGANMVMLGQSDRSNDLSRFSFDHGQKMMIDARTILVELLNGKILKDLGRRKLDPTDETLFNYTKEQLINSVDIATLLIQMEFE